MPWNDLASNQTISFTNLKDAVDLGYFSPKTTIPISNEQVTKDDVNTYVWVNTLFGPFASKTGNQLVVKSNLECIDLVINSIGLLWYGIANNQTTSSPVQLLSGWLYSNDDGIIYRSTDYGQNYSSVLTINQRLYKVKYLPAFRHASYLSVIPFVAVGEGGRIVTNVNADCTSFITVGAPTSQDLYDIAFNSSQAVIVGDSRIIKTGTANRISSWTIVNSVAASWRGVASNGSIFVAVGLNSSIITGDSAGTTWTTRSMPPLSPSSILLNGITYHSDGYFYAVGNTVAFDPFIMRSSNNGVTWELYGPAQANLFEGALYSIESIGDRLIIGGFNYQYQILNNTVTRCGANTGGVSMSWLSIVKNANSNGFDMAGRSVIGATNNIGAYGNF